MTSKLTIGFALLALLPLAAVAAPADQAAGKDHPVISRYAGSILYSYGGSNYGTAPMLAPGKERPVAQEVEGKISNKLYWSETGKGSLEVFRNYQAALAKAGFGVVYQCDNAQCKKDEIVSVTSAWGRNTPWVRSAKTSDIWANNAMNSADEFHYIHARKNATGGAVDIQVGVRAGDFSDPELAGRVQQFVQVVEARALEQGKVAVDARAIGDALKRDGKIALYGILFETNLAVLKPGSDATLDEMGKSLKANPALKVFIVGHTDNVGELGANLALSRKRADAVAAALVKRHAIAADRLLAQGVANFAPVGANDSDDGRAKNRRVEMVVR